MRKVYPKLLVTGASGLVGSNFLNFAKDHFKIFALARRRPRSPELLNHPNITWLYADIGNEFALHEALNEIRDTGGVDFVLHLAGFFDFNYDENPEYYRTNVLGTQNVLNESRFLKIRRFIFASSLAGIEFGVKGEILNEQNELDAQFAYARSKRQGEDLVKSYSKYFKCSTVRLAAVFSDWCEYGPVFMFLRTWLSPTWNSRILGGKGNSAITYIHINCLIALFLAIIRRDRTLPKFDTYIASSDESITHNELYELATKYYYGKKRKSIHVPRFIATFGVFMLEMVGRISGNMPFERRWMMQYIDRQLRVNNDYTCQQLKWQTTKRYKIQRRLLYMIEHMKSYPYEWQNRNNRALKGFQIHSNSDIYEVLNHNRDKIVNKIIETLSDKRNDSLKSYQSADLKALRKDINTTFQFLSVSVRTKDRMSLLIYAREIATTRCQQGFTAQEVMEAVIIEGRIITNELQSMPELKHKEQGIYDEISITFQMMADEIEGTFEYIKRRQEKVFTLVAS